MSFPRKFFVIAVSLAMACIVVMIASRQIGPLGLTALVAILPAIQTARRLRASTGTKHELTAASRGAIATHTLAAVGLIMERCI